MKQNKLLKAASESQKGQNQLLKAFFKENGNGQDWKNKKTDEKYVLTSMQSNRPSDQSDFFSA